MVSRTTHIEEAVMPKTIFILAISLFFISICFAQAKEGEKLPDISKMSKKELNNLPKDVLDQIPLKELLKVYKDGASLSEAAVSLMLGRLAYFEPLSEKATREAIKKFQRDIDQPQTGELTFGQLNELYRRGIRITDNPIYLGTYGDKLDLFRVKDHSVRTQGTWVIEGEKIAHPINHSSIVCYKNRSICEVDTVNISVPSLKESDESYHFNLYKEYFDVISWTNAEVVAQGGTECRAFILTLNILNNEVFQITRNKTEKGCEFGASKIPLLEKPRITRLIPGFKLSFEFWKKRKKATLKYLNSEVQEKLISQIKALEDAKGKNGKKTKSK